VKSLLRSRWSAGRVSQWIIPILLGWVTSASATQLHVPLNYSTIGDALAATVAGDTVRVERGTYAEALLMPRHDVALLGNFVFTGDSIDLDETVIDATPYSQSEFGSVLTFDSGRTRSQVCGFVLTGGHGRYWNIPGDERRWGGAASVYYDHPVIRNCVIRGNQCTNAVAIYAYGSAAQVVSCAIYNNCGEVGVVEFFDNILDGEPAVFAWNEIYDNYACGSYVYPADAGVLGQNCELEVRNNYFHDYEAFQILGVEFYDSRGEILGNRFERLRARNDGVIISVNNFGVPVEDNVFLDLSIGMASAVTLSHDWPNLPSSSVRRNWFEDVVNGGLGPAALYASNPNLAVEDNTFVGCVGGTGAVQFSQIAPRGCAGSILRNQFFLNRSNYETIPAYGSCLNSVGTGPLCEVSQNWFADNVGPICSTSVVGQPVWDLSNNYWGDPSGPYQAIENPAGRGDSVGADIHVTPWLTEPPLNAPDVRERLRLQPDEWSIDLAYPNPFNSTTTIRLVARKPQPMAVAVYNTLGQRVAEIWRGVLAKDAPTLVRWDGRDARGASAASGVYYVVARPNSSFGSAPKTVKALLLR
jgi:hypothetical protein